MLKLIRYSLIVLMLLLGIDKLYAKNYFTANVYNPYNPAQAIATCPEAGVWPNDPSEPFPDPNPASSDCGEINSQVAYGCNIKSTNIGDTLLQSVVVIEVPDISGKPSHDCTATVVNQQWVITAAHCVANFDVNSPQSGSFESALQHFPVIMKSGNHGTDSYEVKAIYIPYHFNYYDEKYLQPYPNYLKEDFALLQLKYPLPAKFKPVDLAQYPLPRDGPLEIWTAGYGLNADQTLNGQLHFRKQYYMTNVYDSKWDGGVSGNHGQIYILGSIPEKYKGVDSAWALNGPGDSGGPILLGNSISKQFYLEGVYNGTINCMYAGFFARLPFSYGVSTSVPYYHDLITSIINGTAPRWATRCISSSGGCAVDNMVYIANYNYDSISVNSLNPNAGVATPLNKPVVTGNMPRKIIFDPHGWFAYVINYGSGSLSIYQVLQDGYLAPPIFSRDISIASGSRPVDIEYNQGYIYIVDHSLNCIYLYKPAADGNLIFKQKILIPRSKSEPLSITFDKNASLAYVVSSYGVLVYKVMSNGQLYYLDTLEINSPTVFKLTRQIGNFEDAYILSSITKTILVYVEGQDGKLSFRQNIKMDDAPTDIEFSSDNSYAYVAHSASKRITIFKVDSEGRLDDIGAIATGAISGGMSLSPSGKYLLVSNPGEASVSVYETMHHVSWLEPTSKFVSRGYTPIMITTLPK